MTRSRKLSGKMTTKQLQKQVEELQGIVSEMIKAMSGDLTRINMVLFGILKQNDWLVEYDCSCGQHLVLPKLDSLPMETHCPACGKEIEDENQSKLSDVVAWDNGGEEE